MRKLLPSGLLVFCVCAGPLLAQQPDTWRGLTLNESTVEDATAALGDPDKVRENQKLRTPIGSWIDADTAKMVTIGGLIYERGQAGITKICDFEGFDFVRTNTRSATAPYMIESPNLTYREIRHLNAQLPRGYGKRLTAPKVSRNDLKRYEKVYRYFPMFAETEI